MAEEGSISEEREAASEEAASPHLPMIDRLWRLLEARVQAAITDRLVTFHDHLVSTGQLTAPVVRVEYSEAANRTRSDPALRLVETPQSD